MIRLADVVQRYRHNLFDNTDIGYCHHIIALWMRLNNAEPVLSDRPPGHAPNANTEPVHHYPAVTDIAQPVRTINPRNGCNDNWTNNYTPTTSC